MLLCFRARPLAITMRLLGLSGSLNGGAACCMPLAWHFLLPRPPCSSPTSPEGSRQLVVITFALALRNPSQFVAAQGQL